MEQRTTGQDGNRFIISERLTVELFLLVYVFVFFLGETTTGTPYIWLLLAIAGGILSYIIFQKRDYSLPLGLLISLAVTLPLLLFNTPLLNVIIFFVFTFWRFQANFSDTKIMGWPFLFVNTVVFVGFYFLVRMMFIYHNVFELLDQLAFLYLATSFLYFLTRLLTIWITSMKTGNFQMKEAGKVFGYITGFGVAVYLIVYFGMDLIRTGIAGVFGFLFGSVFRSFGIFMEPILDFLKNGAETFIEENLEEEDHFVDFRMDEEATVFGNSGSMFETVIFITVMILLVAVMIYLIRKKRQGRDQKKEVNYSFAFRGRKDRLAKESRLSYDYSAAKDEIRKTFERFETEAQQKDMSRMRGETISEWFGRMGWGNNKPLFDIYNNVRYGSHPPTESDFQLFLTEIEKIKDKYFKKDV